MWWLVVTLVGVCEMRYCIIAHPAASSAYAAFASHPPPPCFCCSASHVHRPRVRALAIRPFHRCLRGALARPHALCSGRGACPNPGYSFSNGCACRRLGAREPWIRAGYPTHPRCGPLSFPCTRQVSIVPRDTSLLQAVVRGTKQVGDLGLEVQVVMWTAAGKTGKPCSKDGGACTTMTRSMVLSLSRDGQSLVGGITPDASVDHYLFIVKVSSSPSALCGALTSGRFPRPRLVTDWHSLVVPWGAVPRAIRVRQQRRAFP
jgi:hypothetical protein